MKTVYILLMEYNMLIPRMYKKVTSNKYTHSAIGFENRVFFSFFIKGGFRAEKPWLFPNTKDKTDSCVLYSLSVPDETYDDIKARLSEFKANKKKFRFSTLGLILCFIGIPHRFKNRYFCSQFVAELLSESGALPIDKKPSLYHPHDFTKEEALSLCYQGDIDQLKNAL
ncbi:MAG: hypothetical protein FWD34_05970 [Oscillospiraceae bacterium]|nr:hypothetical protein [Oscillospiraceae bacterium]